MYWKYLKDQPKTLVEVSGDELLNVAVEHRRQVELFFVSKPKSKFISVDLEFDYCGQDISNFLDIEPPQALPKVGRNQSPIIRALINFANHFRR